MLVGLEGRVGIGWQHLGMRIDVYARFLALLEEVLEVTQVVARDEDAGAILGGDIDGRDLGVTVGAGVGAVEEGHAGRARFPDLEHEIGKEGRIAGRRSEDGEVFEKGSLELLVHGVEGLGVVDVGGEPLEPEEGERGEAANILVALGEETHEGFLLSESRIRTVAPEGALGQAGDRAQVDRGHARDRLLRPIQDDGMIEIGVGDRGEKTLDHEARGIAGRLHADFFRRHGPGGKSLGEPYEEVLPPRELFVLAADPSHGAALVPDRFLALIAEHAHDFSSYKTLTVILS